VHNLKDLGKTSYIAQSDVSSKQHIGMRSGADQQPAKWETFKNTKNNIMRGLAAQLEIFSVGLHCIHTLQCTSTEGLQKHVLHTALGSPLQLRSHL